jgi:hypothetical protein
MQCFWTVFVDAKTPEKAAGIASKLEEFADTTIHETSIHSYQKGGHEIRFWINYNRSDWTNMVFDVILTAQRLGHGWIIAGAVNEELSLTSTNPRTQGISMLTCWCSPTHAENDGEQYDAREAVKAFPLGFERVT